MDADDGSRCLACKDLKSACRVPLCLHQPVNLCESRNSDLQLASAPGIQFVDVPPFLEADGAIIVRVNLCEEAV